MSTAQNSFKPYPNPKNSLYGPEKVKNDPKIKSEIKKKSELKELLKIKVAQLYE